MYMPLEQSSRAFLKLHKVFQYRMKKVCDMSDDEVIQTCHWYCVENALTHEFELYRAKKELPLWAWDYSLADAKITNAEMVGKRLIIELDCSYTVLHLDRYIGKLIFENCGISKWSDIVGCFWHSTEISGSGNKQELSLTVSDSKNHKHIFRFRFTDVFAEKQL